HCEAFAVRSAAGIVSVSPDYLVSLAHRCQRGDAAWMTPGRSAVIPFGAADADLDVVRNSARRHKRQTYERAKIVYVCAGGPIMERSFALICRALVQLRMTRPELLDSVEIQLYGTVSGWRKGDRRDLADIAHNCGLSEFVQEYPVRISYARSLELLLDSD